MNAVLKVLQNEIGYSSVALTNGQMKNAAPAVFAKTPHDSRKEKYSFVPTSDIVDQMRKGGFLPFFVTQMRSKTRPEHTKHMIRFRHESFLGAKMIKKEGAIPEIILVNSHDGTSNYILYTGVYRMSGEIGSIAGDSFDPVKLRHNANPIAEIEEQSRQLLNESARILDRVHEMKEVHLSISKALKFAEGAAEIKAGEYEVSFQPVDLLETHRPEDKARDLWTIFNVVLENLMKGGLPGEAESGRPTKTRSIRNINEMVRINRELWNLAETFVPNLKVHTKQVENSPALSPEEELEELRKQIKSLKRKLTIANNKLAA